MEPPPGPPLQLCQVRWCDVHVQPVNLAIGAQGLDALAVNAHEAEPAGGCDLADRRDAGPVHKGVMDSGHAGVLEELGGLRLRAERGFVNEEEVLPVHLEGRMNRTRVEL